MTFALVLLAMLLGACLHSGGHGPAAGKSPEQRLAEKFAPVLELAQDDYDPVEVGILLDETACTAALRSAATSAQLSDCATAAVLGDHAAERGAYLDVKALGIKNPASAGADATDGDYLRLYRALVEEHHYRTVTYARVRAVSGRLLIDYWFFYFYDFVSIGSSDLTSFGHEGDWERVQLVFAAPSASDALKASRAPSEIGYSQHTCDNDTNLVRRPWPADGSGLVEGRPLVYVGLGTHANFPTEGAQIGTSPCTVFDVTIGQRQVRPEVRIIDCAAPQDAWLRFAGLWGEVRSAGFSSGPRGPCFHGS